MPPTAELPPDAPAATRGLRVPPRPPCLRDGLLVATAAVLGLGSAGLVASAVAVPPPTPSRPPLVRQLPVRAVEPRPHQDVIEIDGVLEPARRVDLSLRVPGRVTEVLVDEGDAVEAGAALLRVDAAPLKAAHALALARVAEAEAGLLRLTNGTRPEDLLVAAEAEASARARFEHVEKEAARLAQLRARNAVTTATLDAAQAEFDAARAGLASARAAHAKARQGARPEEVAAARAAHAAARARAEAARLDLEAATLTAPFAGRVARKPAAAGTYLRPGEPALRLLELATLDARVGVPEKFLDLFREGTQVEVTAPHRRLRGEVVSLAPTIDPHTRTFFARVRIENPGSLLRAGQAVTCRAKSPVEQVLALAPEALVTAPGGQLAVMVATPGDETWSVTRRRVEGRWLDDGQVAITQGLRPGEQVVTGGGAWLLDGDRILPVTRVVQR